MPTLIHVIINIMKNKITAIILILSLSCNKHKYINIKGFWNRNITSIENSKGDDILKYEIFGICDYVFYIDSIDKNNYLMKTTYYDSQYNYFVYSGDSIPCYYDYENRTLKINNNYCFASYKLPILKLIKNSNNNNYHFEGKFEQYTRYGNYTSGLFIGPDTLTGDWIWTKR